MNTYITHSGTGTEVNEISLKGLLALVDKTVKVKEKLILSLQENNKSIDDEDLTLENLECYEMPIDILSECLNEIAKVEAFLNIEDDEGYDYILFVDMAPWEYTTREKNLKKKDVIEYLNLLKDAVPNMEIEDLYIANYIND